MRSLLSESRANILPQRNSPGLRSQFDSSLKVTVAAEQIGMTFESSDS